MTLARTTLGLTGLNETNGTSMQTLGFYFFTSMGCQKENGDIRGFWHGLKVFEHSKPSIPWHHHIQQNQVRLLLLHTRKAWLPLVAMNI